VSDDLVAEQQLPVGAAITVVGFVGVVGFIRFIGVFGWRLPELQPLIRQLRWPAVPVPTAGIRRLERRQSVAQRLERWQ